MMSEMIYMLVFYKPAVYIKVYICQPYIKWGKTVQ